MSEEETEKAVLSYLGSHADEEHDSFQSLTTIFEQTVRSLIPHVSRDDVDDDIESKDSLRAMLDQMVSDGLLDSRWGERDYEASYRLTDQGRYEASGFDQLALSPNVLTTESGEPLFTEKGEFLEVEDASKEEPISVDSSKWTGLTKTVIDARNAKVVSDLIGKALDTLSASEAGNFEIMQASAYLKAARELVVAPEPPSEEVWRFIGRAADVVGLVSIFYAIFAQVITHAQTH